MAFATTGVGETYAPVRIENEGGTGAFVFLCEHASNYIPPSFAALGLNKADLDSHIAWDPGALGLARHLAALLDGPLVACGLSRLLIDCNRELNAKDLIPTCSEVTLVPGNADLDAAARQHRIDLSHIPFHAVAEAVIAGRLAAGIVPTIISVHSYTPTFKGAARPWEIGLLHDQAPDYAKRVIAALRETTEHVVGDNEPYAPADGVYYSLNRHAHSRGLPHLMIEVRNDLLQTGEQEETWAATLAPVLLKSLSDAPQTRGSDV